MMIAAGFRDFLSMFLGWKARRRQAPFRVVAAEIYLAGAALGEVASPGAVAGLVS